MNFLARQERVRRELVERQLEALVVTHVPNIRYLTGFTGSAGIAVVTLEATYFITDSRYTLQAQTEVAARLFQADDSYERAVVDHLKRERLRRVGVEAERLSLARYEFFTRELDGEIEWVPTRGIIEEVRMVKDAEEQQAIRRAVEVAAQVFAELVEEIRPGMRERDVAAELEYRLRRAGAERIAFETIVASGERSAWPHGVASEKRIGYNEFVVIDFGVVVEGYCSDMTRTFYVGTPDARAREVYATVLEAQLRCEAEMRAGMRACEIDALTRDLITARGYGAFYGHATGHGIGLEVHEAPRLSRHNEARVPAGAVVTVEPGIYLPQWGGVRIEDVVIVNEHGSEVLTPTPKDLLVV
ncbi:MAG: aminopeptidase P family protein [Blastocatellia bacterium]|nr:aminopeptidase P family protein [Blastocatellia bacterium]MCS7157514.1 aminopeptidase P family protein [Blastocatellia bacterium]MDW8255614.1 aminopeptidase P family protein [Acidobacteriota bacterium]